MDLAPKTDEEIDALVALIQRVELDKLDDSVYQPTANTVLGRAQCFDLVVANDIIREFEDYDMIGWSYKLLKDTYTKDHPTPVLEDRHYLNQGFVSPQRCICEAVILSHVVAYSVPRLGE